jgi:NAD(P)-dependent dehydrogenase (short-subunit alcohol dehydrogenase family)
MNLDGEVAIVTGAGRGIGKAIAHALAEAGCAVVINDIDADVADETVQAITSAGGKAVAVPGPVGPTETANELVARAVDAFGHLTVMCTNAGNLHDRLLWNMTDDDFDSVIETHLRGTFTCARAAVTKFREQKQGGRLILLGSPAGQLGGFGQTNYAAAKAGIVAMTQTWAMECVRARITVNAIIPRAITRMLTTTPEYADLQDRLANNEPLPEALRNEQGIGVPEDVAPLAVFLASEAAAGITGQCIGIGGDKLSMWSYSREFVELTRPGGWRPEDIDDAWQQSLASHVQTNG